MSLKGDIVAEAYAELRISGLTVQPGAEEFSYGLSRLEQMMFELSNRNICNGYNFEQNPDGATESGLDIADDYMAAVNLAIRLIPSFNKQVPAELKMQASQALSNAAGRTLTNTVRMVQYPRRMARGSGSTLRFNRWQRFYREQALPDNNCATNRMIVGEINDFQESFEAYLDGETITAAVVTATSGLTLLSDSESGGVVSYRVEANSNISTTGNFQWVNFQITTNTGRVELRQVSFEVADARDI